MCSVKAETAAAPLSALTAVSGMKEYAQLEVGAEGDLYWVEYRPDLGGRNLLVRHQSGCTQTLTPEGFSVASRVHEYGGLSWCLIGAGSWVFVNQSDQQLYLQSLNHLSPEPLTNLIDVRYGAPVHDRYRHRVLVVEEDHRGDDVINRLVAINLQNGHRHVLHEGEDFYSAPVLSASGNRCLCIAWNHPYQPWIATKLLGLWFDDGGNVEQAAWLLGEHDDQSIIHPGFDSTGRVIAISDESGWWNLCRFNEEEHTWEPLWSVQADCATAPWQLGGKPYQIVGEDIFIARLHRGAMALLRIHQGEPVQAYAAEYTHFRGWSADSGHLYMVVASPTCLPKIVSIDIATGAIAEIAPSAMAISPISEPQYLTFPVAGEEAYGYFYPANIHDSQPPPVVFFLHGGPTACSYPVLNPRIQYWTQQGFAVLDLNYRGSSGYGRAYRMKLHKAWGQVEVDDALAALAYLIERRLVDPDSAFIRGSSAGGFTALMALAFGDQFAAGASLYGVTDPLVLAKGTHKFESHYLSWLMGDPETERENYHARAPIYHVERINQPVIFFQGGQDKVVLPEQTERLVRALQEKQADVECHIYDDEAHGFRDASNLADALEKELKFYCKIISSSS